MGAVMRLRIAWGLSAIAAVTLLFGVACGDGDDDGVQVQPPVPADSDSPTTPEADGGEESLSEADFAIEVQDKLTQFQNELAELETEAVSMNEAARAEVEPMLEELRTTITALENRLIDLEATPEGPSRDAVKSEIEDTLDLAQTQIDELQDAVGI